MANESSPTVSSTPRSSPPICSEPMDVALKSYFGFSSLKTYQKNVIDKIFEGRDCLVVRATGAGKSLCYQLPPLVSKKTAIVVSPLLSLMQDQVMRLKEKGINADYLGSTQKNKSVLTNAQNGYYDVLYLTPEKARSLPNRFWTDIIGHGVSLFAVDEAHCISEWGTDFRQDFKMLHAVRAKLPGVPCVALTATATDRVRADIISSLKLDEVFICIGSFDRPNIFYSVKLLKGPARVHNFIDQVIKQVQSRFAARESTIIYCNTIRDTEDVHDALLSNGVQCCLYHGQMERSQREKYHKSFSNDEVVVMVATMAFGMGIDKPDVRCVIHYGCPKSLESYYQESGRAGRDGLPSFCYLYYSRADFCRGDLYCSDSTSEKQKEAIMNAYIAAQNYCMIASCRRKELLSYFGEFTEPNCGNCDNCTNSQSMKKDFFEEAVLLITSIKYCGLRWGLNMPINVLRGSKAKKILENKFNELSVHGKGKSRSVEWWKCLASILTSNGYLADTTSGFLRIVSITTKGYNLINSNPQGHQPLVFSLPQEMIDEENETTPKDDLVLFSEDLDLPSQTIKNEEYELYQLLDKVCTMLAKDRYVTPYEICNDQFLTSLARTRPSDKGTLNLVSGVTQVFVDRYSPIFLHHVKEFADDFSLPMNNFDLEEFQTPPEPFPFQSGFIEIPDKDISHKIMDMISSSTGIFVEEIVQAFPIEIKKRVLDALDELDQSFQIISKGGMYFPI